jgi:hypothetical protein
MASPTPLYTTENCIAAYQLNWSLSLFAREALPPVHEWQSSLMQATEADGVRILEQRLMKPNLAQFFLSSKPDCSPSHIVRSIKGRLQYMVRERRPRAFRRNYRIESVGAANSKSLDLHIALGCDIDVAPSTVALSFMNNVAYLRKMRPVLRFSLYVGGFGPYDRNLVRRTLNA